MLKYVTQDLHSNKQLKMKLALCLFRLGQFLRARKRNPIAFLFYAITFASYHFWVRDLWGIEVPFGAKVGPNFKIYHGAGLVINADAKIGRNVTLRHCTTIGNKGHAGSPSPVIGDNVSIGCNSVILGGITIGDNSFIGAGSVVLNNVPANAVVAGNPAKIIKIIK